MSSHRLLWGEYRRDVEAERVEWATAWQQMMRPARAMTVGPRVSMFAAPAESPAEVSAERPAVVPAERPLEKAAEKAAAKPARKRIRFRAGANPPRKRLYRSRIPDISPARERVWLEEVKGALDKLVKCVQLRAKWLEAAANLGVAHTWLSSGEKWRRHAAYDSTTFAAALVYLLTPRLSIRIFKETTTLAVSWWAVGGTANLLRESSPELDLRRVPRKRKSPQ